MKQTKLILVIDDKDQTRELESIQEDLDHKFKITSLSIRTSEARFRQEGNNYPDANKLKTEIDTLFDQYKYFDLILSDFDLNAEGIVDGLDLIEHVKSRCSTAKIIMYSGNYTRAVRKLINNPTGALTELDIAAAVSKFIGYRLVDCIDRTSYKDKVKKYFEEDKELSIRHELVKLLYEHEDMEFNSCCPKYKGKKFGEIAKEIERNNHSYTDEWIMAMIHQAAAYLVKVNSI